MIGTRDAIANLLRLGVSLWGSILLVYGQPPKPMTFAVTSVRSLNAGEPRGGGFGCSSEGRFSSNAYSVRIVMKWAFGVSDFQLQNMPRWTGGAEGFFHIEAQAEGPVTQDQCKQMVQALLTERFQLKLHPEMRDTKVLALVVGKGGSKMARADESDKTPGVVFVIDGAPRRMDSINVALGQNPPGLTMAQLAEVLPISNGNDGPPVVDHTGLEGLYRIQLEFGTTIAGGRMRDERFQDIGGALQTLGLKLEEKTEPFPVLVIERMEKPGEN